MGSSNTLNDAHQGDNEASSRVALPLEQELRAASKISDSMTGLANAAGSHDAAQSGRTSEPTTTPNQDDCHHHHHQDHRPASSHATSPATAQAIDATALAQLQNSQHSTTADDQAPQQQQQQQQQQQPQWLAQVASQTQQGVRHRMSQASDQLGHSLRQLYASASSITTAVGATGAAAASVVDVPPSYHNIPGIVPYYHGRSIGPPPSYDDVINPYAPPPTYQSLFGQMREARKSSRGLLDLLRRLLIILVSTLGCTLLIAFMILIPFTMIIVGAIYIDECKIEHIPAFLLVGGLVWAAKNVLHCYAQCRKVEQHEQSDALTAEMYLNSGSSLQSSSSSSSQRRANGTRRGGEQRTRGADSVSARSASTSSSSSFESQLAGAATTTSPGDLNEVDDLQLGQQIIANNHHAHDHHVHNHHDHHHHHHHRRHRHSRRDELRHEQRTSRFKSSVCESLLNCILFGWFIAGCVIVLRNYEPDFENTASARYCHRTVYMYTFWLITSALLSLGLFIGCICCLMVSSALASRADDIDLA